MSSHPFLRLAGTAALGAMLVAATACSTDNLATATTSNIVDTVTIGALLGTPLTVPSGFSVSEGRPIRTDQTSQFDFAFNVSGTTSQPRRVFLPRALLGFQNSGTADPGLLKVTDRTFDQIDLADLNGYVAADTVPIGVGDVLIARSRIVCSSGVPQYGKLEVMSFQELSVTFRVLVDSNCGYRSLQPGIPTK
jgi:hypothetical protein